MKDNDRVTHITPETIQELLSEDDGAGRHAPGGVSLLVRGDEYLNLDHLERGVRRCARKSSLLPHVLPRKDVQEATWNKIVLHLPIVSKKRHHA
jgi:hypothetical protein